MFFNIKIFLKLYKNNYFNNYLIISENYFFIEEIKNNIKKISSDLNILIKNFFIKKDLEEILKKLNNNKNIFKNKELFIIEILNDNFDFKNIFKILKFKNYYINILIIIKNYEIFKNKLFFKKIFLNFICLKFKISYYKILIKKKFLNLNFKKKYIFLNIILKNKIILNYSKEIYKIYFYFLNKKIKKVFFFLKKIYKEKNIKNYILKFNKKNIFKLINYIKYNIKIDYILKIIFNFLEKILKININYKKNYLIKFIKKLIYFDFKIKDIKIKNKFLFCNWDIIFIILISLLKLNKIYNFNI